MLGDYKIDVILIKWCKEANLGFYRVTYKFKANTLYIYTARPGLLIGRHGALSIKYVNELREKVQKDINVEFVEVAEIMTDDEWNEYIRGRGF